MRRACSCSQIEYERRQRQPCQRERALLRAPPTWKLRKGRAAGTAVRVVSNAVTEVVADEGLNLIGEHGQQDGRRQRAVGNGLHHFVDRFEDDDPVFVHVLPTVATLERKRQALGAPIGIGNSVLQRGEGLSSTLAKVSRECLASRGKERGLDPQPPGLLFPDQDGQHAGVGHDPGDARDRIERVDEPVNRLLGFDEGYPKPLRQPRIQPLHQFC